MIRVSAVLCVACNLAALLFGMEALSQTAVAQETPQEKREARWLLDIDYFADQFPKRERDFRKLYPKQEFDNQLGTIRRSVSKVTDSELIFDLTRLVASGHVAHTRVVFPSGELGFHMLPVSMNWFPDGLAVVAAVDAYRDTLGTRVARIGSMTPQQLEAAVTPYISYEADAALHVESPSFMVIAELLQHLGLTGNDGSVEFLLDKPDGTEFAKRIYPVAASNAVQQISMYDVLAIPPTLNRRHPAKKYWYEHVSATQALYIQYNECDNDPKLPFADFTKAMFEYADTHSVQRVILDLRFNPGGNSEVIKPLKWGLEVRPTLFRRGHLFALIGPGTFSSAAMAAMEFHRDLGAILVGEALAEKPNSYGDVRSLTLPNSQVRVQYSTKYFEFNKQRKDAPPLAPEIFAPQSLADALAGRDPALETALQRPLN